MLSLQGYTCLFPVLPYTGLQCSQSSYRAVWYGSERRPNVQTLSNGISTYAIKVRPVSNNNGGLWGQTEISAQNPVWVCKCPNHNETNILDVIFVQDSKVSVLSNPKISFPFGKFHIALSMNHDKFKQKSVKQIGPLLASIEKKATGFEFTMG